MNQRHVCYYHDDCFDGTAAALVTKLAVPDVVLIPANYGDVPKVADVANAVVYVVDFSFSDEAFELLLTQADRIVVLDHHPTALPLLRRAAELAKVLSPESVFKYSEENSGAHIAWSHFFPDRFVPPFINHVSDRDTWSFSRDGTRDVMAGVSTLKNCPEAWYREMGFNASMDIDEIEKVLHEHCTRFLKDGPIIRAKESTIIDALLKNNIQHRSSGYRCKEDSATYERRLSYALVNIPRQFTSDGLAHILRTDPTVDFAVGYYIDGKGVYRYSLRSRKTGDVDVSLICARYGGGGHFSAAGCSYDPTKDPYGDAGHPFI